ncbi:hypothetical protein D9M71_840390 [compost metagenome]
MREAMGISGLVGAAGSCQMRMASISAWDRRWARRLALASEADSPGSKPASGNP